MKTGRNEPCPCGSGKKYKNCHADQSPEKMATDRMGWIVVAVVAAGAISLFATLRPDKASSSSGSIQAPATTPLPTPVSAPVSTPVEPPPGDPPPGKVWSKEHGHWHDVSDSSQIQVSTASVPIGAQSGAPATAGTPVPQPPGPAPEGKVWSPEHGHWHNKPGAATTDSTVPPELQPYMKPPGVPAAPAGAVWSEEHQHWHNAEKEQERKAAQQGATSTTTTPKPDNR